MLAFTNVVLKGTVWPATFNDVNECDTISLVCKLYCLVQALKAVFQRNQIIFLKVCVFT